MKKRTFLLAGLVSLLTAQPALAAAPADIIIENKKVAFTAQSGQPFLDENERTQVPLRAAMEAFGCTVRWDESAKTAIVEKNGVTVQAPIGTSYLIVNGQKKANDTSAVIKDGRTYLPIRAVLEAFGATVTWDAGKNAVLVTSGSTASTDRELTVHFIDVGQADAILIDYGTYEVLIDGGNNKDGETIVSYLKNYVDGNLELMIATHPDADHIGGLDDVLAAYQVDRIIDSGASKDTKTYKDYWAAALAEGAQISYDEDMTISLGSGNAPTLTIIETGDGYTDSNDNSVVSLLEYGDVSVLLTGDMEKKAEAASLHKFTPVTVLKAGHHGSSTSSSQAFLDRVQPEYVIISAGKDNSYRHPHKAVLERFFQSGATVYGTFRSGTIRMTTNGRALSFDTNDPFILSDAGDIA